LKIGGKEHRAPAGSLVMIPARTPHHVKNPGRTPLFFVTVYAPPAY
jgi:mannose-6-phosphate isomerase-like protein (cupin superfamily)